MSSHYVVHLKLNNVLVNCISTKLGTGGKGEEPIPTSQTGDSEVNLASIILSHDLVLIIFIPFLWALTKFSTMYLKCESWFYSNDDLINPKHTRMIIQRSYIYLQVSVII